ncbi:hypothetical protein GPAL_1070 [Glaciecola pallidula DSM 14239 = ACAM 615]|uniref:Uncharacterized protein n=1 Tax=Brumicola pallidula DSM 14239 = ACAM 615 TaxID=1121922 RepID=K6Y584_9ALTE|nr:hypothetical protein GPAL_1070 [Glaciecola pallidula DSM 14239 = ACAM 615]
MKGIIRTHLFALAEEGEKKLRHTCKQRNDKTGVSLFQSLQNGLIVN